MLILKIYCYNDQYSSTVRLTYTLVHLLQSLMTVLESLCRENYDDGDGDTIYNLTQAPFSEFCKTSLPDSIAANTNISLIG